MSTPDTDTYESQVNSALAAATTDDKGKLSFADDVPEHIQYAARQTKRHRDTQSAYTKSQQRVTQLEAENNGLAASWEQDAIANLSSTDKARLEELKHQDPEEWRQEITALEAKKREEFGSRRQEIAQKATQATELEQREAMLAQFNQDNPDIKLDDDFLANDIPPRITKKLEASGDFAGFLDDIKKYVSKGKAIDTGERLEPEPTLAGVRGSSKPSQSALQQQDASDYDSEIF